jgi:hypothetical protein
MTPRFPGISVDNPSTIAALLSSGKKVATVAATFFNSYFLNYNARLNIPTGRPLNFPLTIVFSKYLGRFLLKSDCCVIVRAAAT